MSSETNKALVVYLHGLTFDRRTWRRVLDRLAWAVTSIAMDLPAHGDSSSEPAPLDSVTQTPRPCDSWRPR